MTRPPAARGPAAVIAVAALRAGGRMLAAVAVAWLVFDLVPSRAVHLLAANLTLTGPQVTALRHGFGVGEPPDVRAWHLLENTARLRLGFSYQFQRPVAALLGRDIGPTLLLMGSAALLAEIAGRVLRRVVGSRAGGLGAVAEAAPAFWIGLVLLVALGVGAAGFPAVFPAGGFISPGISARATTRVPDVLWHLVLPCVTLAFARLGQSAVLTRSPPPAFARVGAFVSATVAVEVVFSWPGLGGLADQALQTPDVPVLQGTFLALSAIAIAVALVLEAGAPLAARWARPAPAAEGPRPGAVDVGRAERVRAFLRTPGGFTGVTVLVLILAWTLAAPLFVHPSQLAVVRDNAPILRGPTLAQPLGTDETGRPELALVLWGGRSSLVSAAVAGAAALLVAVVIGGVGRRWPRLTGRPAAGVTSWFAGVGTLPLAISLAAIIGPGEASLAIAVALTCWPATARLIRQHAPGEPIGLLCACAALVLADALLWVTTLSFLGLGDPFRVSWGAILNQAFVYGDVTSGAWWTLVAPGMAVLVTVLALRVAGRAAEGMLSGPAPPSSR